MDRSQDRLGLRAGARLVLALTVLTALVQQISWAQAVGSGSPRHHALYEFSSQANWIAFRPHSKDLAVALYGTRDGGKALLCRSWSSKLNRDVTIDTMSSPCFCVAFSADGSRLAWCSWTPGKQIRVATDRAETKTINCGKAALTALAFNPSASYELASVATDGIVRLWDISNGRLLRQLTSDSSRGLCIGYSNDGRYMAAGFKDGHVRLWRTNGYEGPDVTLEGHAGPVNSLAFTPDSRWLATASSDKKIIIWDCATDQRVHELEQQHLDPIACLAFTPDGSYLASGDASGKVIFWNMKTLRPARVFFPHRQPIYGLAISSDGDWMATASQDRSVRVYATAELGYRPGRVRLLAVKEKVEIKVDGEPSALDEAAGLTLPPGPHQIQVTTEDGTNSKTYPVNVVSNSESTVTVDVTSSFGTLYVAADRPSDFVAANGSIQRVGPVNQALERVTPGRYTVTITPRNSAYDRQVREIEIKAGETVRVSVTMHLAYGDMSPPDDISARGQIRTNPRDGAEMVWIPPGVFTMGREDGDRDVRPPHAVSLSGFWMYRMPVTVAQYRRFCSASVGTAWERRMPPAPKWGWQAEHPMVMISWQEAADYSRWAFGSDQRVFLPTEAQYERAMQGPDHTEYPWGDVWADEQCVNSVPPAHASGTQPAAGLAPNGYGLYEMAGNVWEWCIDWYNPAYYRTAPLNNPTGPATGSMRSIRGGAWDSKSAKSFRSDFRGRANPKARTVDTGFRCAAGP